MTGGEQAFLVLIIVFVAFVFGYNLGFKEGEERARTKFMFAQMRREKGLPPED